MKNSSKKILFLAYDFPVSENETLISGEIKNPYSMALELIKSGHKITVLTNKRTTGSCFKLNKVNHSEIDVLYWKDLPFFRGFFRYLLRSFQNLYFSINIKRDIVYSHSAYSSLFLSDKNIVLCPHGTNVPEFNAETKKNKTSLILKLKRLNSLIQFKLDSLSMKKSFIVQSVSLFQIKEMNELYNVNKDKIKLIYNIPLVSHFKNTDNLHNKDFDVIFIGRLAKKKGLPLLIDFANKMFDKKILVIGGNEFFTTEDTIVIDKLNLTPNIKIINNVSEIDLIKYIKKSKMLLVTSFGYESLPTVILESLTLGTEVLAPKSWGNIEVLEEHQLYKESDFDDLIKSYLLLKEKNSISNSKIIKKIQDSKVELNQIFNN